MLYGFTFLRNGVKYDYPFKETLLTLASLCQEVYLALGDSEDQTAVNIPKDPKIRIMPTVWDESLRSGGKILSQQTNVALSALEQAHPQASAWGLYLQCDEVIGEWDFEKLKNDLKAAETCGADAIRFRYLHFWATPDQIAIAKRWYPTEIRCIRLNQGIQSSGDAQSFSGCQKIYDSEVCVFHYGHVRKKEAWELKKHDFHHWYHTEKTIGHVRERSKSSDAKEPVAPYLGPHPLVMQERLNQGQTHQHHAVDPRTVVLVDFDQSLEQAFVGRILAKKVVHVKDAQALREIRKENPSAVLIYVRPRWWQYGRLQRLGRKGAPRFPTLLLTAFELARNRIRID